MLSANHPVRGVAAMKLERDSWRGVPPASIILAGIGVCSQRPTSIRTSDGPLENLT
jgi:hypothetical protein